MFQTIDCHQIGRLNHGTIKSPIPGKEAGIVLTRCKNGRGKWVKSESVMIRHRRLPCSYRGVDTASILEQANPYDTDGARRKQVRICCFRR